MTSKTTLLAFALVSGFATTALGANEVPGKIVLGLRLGYSIPIGSVDKTADGAAEKMSNTTSGHVPIWLDLGYMVTTNVMVGLYGQYGIGFVGGDRKTECDQGSSAGVSCSVSNIRFGVQGQYHVSPTEGTDPWFGLGIGYEMAKFHLSGPGGDLSITAKGFEFVNLQGGLDIKPMPMLGVGPFVSFSIGQFDSISTSGSLSSYVHGGDITNKAIHEWLTLGVRGVFNL
jgi:outer membrane protein W